MIHSVLENISENHRSFILANKVSSEGNVTILSRKKEKDFIYYNSKYSHEETFESSNINWNSNKRDN